MYSLCESADNRLLTGGKFNSQIGCQINEETVDYFYGCICREVAEYILHERNCGEGLYLLRQSNGDFVLSLCNSDSILHYRIIRFPTGELALNGLEAQRFTSIDLLISSVDGLATRPTIPCLRSKGWSLPPTYWGVDANVIKQTIIKKTREWGLSDCLLPKLFPCTASTLNNCELENRVQNELNNISTYALMQQNGQNLNIVQDKNQDTDKKDIPAWQQHLLDYDRNLIGEVTKSLLLKSFHEIQPWYHGRLSRLDAEKRIIDSGHKDGKFLVREREENGFALCVSHEATIKHYRIDALSSGEFAIQDGHKFPSLLALISHYTVFSDGLWTSLTDSCQRRTLAINNSNVLNDTNSVQNLNLLNRALNRASDIYPTATYSIQQPNTLTGNSTSSSSSCSSNSSLTTNRLNNSSKAKIKEWLININQRWSQLLASMQCRPNGSHQLIHDCDSIKYGIVQYSNSPDPSQINMYNYQLYSAAVAAATAAVAAAKQQQLNNSKINLRNVDCNHHICPTLYGQCKNNFKSTIDNSLSCQQTKLSNTTNCLKNNCKEFDQHSINLPCHQKNHTAFQNSSTSNENSNLKSMMNLSSPLIYLDYNKASQNSLSFRSLNCETNTRQLYGLLSGNDNLSSNNKTDRPWSNTATLAPKRVSTQSNQNNLKNQNIQLIQKNLNKQNSIQNSKGQTLPTIYESNHYKETDLQLLFNSFNNQKNSSIPPPLPPDPPPVSSNSNSLTVKKNTINNLSSNIEHHHQPSAVLKQLPNNTKNNSNETDSTNTELSLEPSNNLKLDNLKINKIENDETVNLSSQQNTKVIKNDNHSFNKNFEEVITIYQRPVPLPGRIIKSSSLEDLFKIKVCKLNPLCPNNEITNKQKAIIFCANPGPLTKIKDKKEPKLLDTSVTKLMNQNINLSKTLSQETKKNENQSKTEPEETVVIDSYFKNDTSAINESNKKNCSSATDNATDNEIYDYSKNSLNTAIAASFKGFLGDLQACKQNQLALSTFRPILGNTQNSTGITGTLNTSSSLPTSISNPKVDSAVEQINTMANPYSFSTKKQLTKQSSQELTIEQLNKLEQQTDITDLLKEFDVCFADDGPSSNESSSSDLISFTNELNNSTKEKNNLLPDSLSNSRTINNNSSVNLINPVKNLETVGTQINQAINCSLENSNNNSVLANLLDTTALKQASLGPATLETCGSKIQLTELDLICFEEDPEKIKETLQKYKQSPLSLDPNFINLKQKLGNGFFGEVFLGEITANLQPSVSTCTPALNVAVKVLKSQNVPNHKMDILKEAQTMASLDHKHIVRLIGVCESDPLMLIMELAPIGPLNRYLQENQTRVRLNHILVLMRQVALAMRYLETKMYIHRDLAARNVLLVNEHFVKISDFGMSRALGIGKEYYKARNASKWPLKWYAPECIYYFKFSSKSDVWSYGVTLWEATSYGKKPYEGMDGQKILKLFRENKRLSKPANCPEEIYQLMWCCWQLSPDNRPSFVEICDFLTMILCRTHSNITNKISN